MGKIKKILENELRGGTQSTDVYPVTSTKAVYDENNERLDNILAAETMRAKAAEQANTQAITDVAARLNDQKDEVDAAKEEALQAIAENEQSAITNFNSQRVTPEMLSESTKQLIEASGGGTITNLADDEDIQSVNDGTGSNVLKFANREYNPVNFSGKGYKILRKNIQDGKNILIQEMINDPNTVYEIRYDFDLDKKTINIPAGCIIFFNGGLIKNGTVNANYCYFRYLEYKCFDNIIIKNRILNKSLSAVAFGFGVDNNADVLNFMLKNVNVPTVTLPEGGYDIDKPIVVYSNRCLVGAGTGANIGSTILYPVGNWHTNYPNRGVIETFNFSWKSEDG